MQNIIYYLSFLNIDKTTLIYMGALVLVFLGSLISKNFFSGAVIAFIPRLFSKTRFRVEIKELEPAKKALNIIFVFSLTCGAAFFFSSLLGENSRNYTIILSVAKRIYRAAMIVAISVLLYSLIPPSLRIYNKISKNRQLADNPIVGLFIERILRVLTVCVCIIAILSELGINVNGLITGIGLGGLTFALAAQDTAANIFGGLVIISDRPFLVGDWISTDNFEGVVEDISFRSTRIRTFDDALVIVPNSKLSSVAITNWAKMSKRRVNMKLGLSYSTDATKLRNIIASLRLYLSNHSKVISDSIIVRLDELSPGAINIRAIFYADVTALADLKAIIEEVNFEIIRIAGENDSMFSSASVVVKE